MFDEDDDAMPQGEAAWVVPGVTLAPNRESSSDNGEGSFSEESLGSGRVSEAPDNLISWQVCEQDETPDNPGDRRNPGAIDSDETAAFGDGAAHQGWTSLCGADSSSVAVMATRMGELLDSLPADVAQAVPDALAALGQLMPRVGQLHTLIAQLAVAADVDGLHALDGSRSLLAYMARHLPISFGQAKTHLGVGRSLRDHLPGTLAAMRSGRLGWEAGQAMAALTTQTETTLEALTIPVPADAHERAVIRILRQRAECREGSSDPGTDARPLGEANASASTEPNPGTSEPGPTGIGDPGVPGTGASGDLADGWVRCEDWLVARGMELTLARFKRLLKYWAAMVDPETAETAYKESEADAHITAAQTLDCCHIQGKLDPEGGKVLLAALDAFRPAYDAGHPTSIAERNACALETIARIALETNLAGDSASARPHIGLTISWETFCAMAAHAGTPAAQLAAMADLPPAQWADNTGPIPHSVFASIACDSDITRIVFGPRGQLINLGRTNRVITPGLRQAVIARDKHCVFTDCDAPPVMCQAHHVHRWSHGGKTDADNLALVCRYHHRWIHANNITIRPRGPAPGRPEDTNPPGATLFDAQPHYDFIDRHGHPMRQ